MGHREWRARPKRSAFPPNSDPRTLRLCSEAREAISLALATVDDPRLEDTYVLAVRPHPDASCLLVVVAAPERDVAKVKEALTAAQPRLRGELAGAIERKRVPDLAFTVLPHGSAEVE